jgi:hypothetical protein
MIKSLSNKEKEHTVQQPLPKPLNNHLLVKIEREYDQVIHYESDEQLKRGVVLNTNFNRHHLTGMGGYAITDNENEYKTITEELDYLVGKTVYWGEGAEAGQVIVIGEVTYALVPWWRLTGFADDAPEVVSEPEVTIVESE